MKDRKKENSSSNEFMLSGFRISMKFALMCAWEHFRICFWGRVGGAVGGPVGGWGGGGLRRQAHRGKKGYVCVPCQQTLNIVSTLYI